MVTTRMSQQELFDKAVEGLASQGFKRSMTDLGKCAYRGENNMKCAIGHLVTDEQLLSVAKTHVGLHKSSSSETFNGFWVGFGAFAFSPILGHDRSFLDALQAAHDMGHKANDMIERLRDFAREYRLSTESLDAAVQARRDAAIQATLY